MSSQPEVEWDDTEQAWMRALAEYRAGLCPLCGGPKDLCQGPGAEFLWRGAPPTRCHRTTAILRAQDDYASGVNAGHTQALLWGAQGV